MNLLLTKLEMYGIVAVLLVAAILGAYFKGRNDEKDTFASKQLIANAKVLQDSLDSARARMEEDDKARQTTEEFIARTRQGLSDVNTKFSKLPNVVVDARGCPQLGDNFRLRWDTTSGVSTGPALDTPGVPIATLPVAKVPSAF